LRRVRVARRRQGTIVHEFNALSVCGGDAFAKTPTYARLSGRAEFAVVRGAI
jgi:hypothetical protein